MGNNQHGRRPAIGVTFRTPTRHRHGKKGSGEKGLRRSPDGLRDADKPFR